MSTKIEWCLGNTPGPWHRNIPPATHYPTVFAGRNSHIAVLNTKLPAEEVEANCNLISSCPDMAHALWVIATHEDAPDDPVSLWMARTAKAALNKAMGHREREGGWDQFLRMHGRRYIASEGGEA